MSIKGDHNIEQMEAVIANMRTVIQGIRKDGFRLKVLAQQLRDLSRDERQADIIFKQIEEIIG